MYLKNIIFILLLSGCVYNANAQNLVMEVTPKTVDIGEPLELRFSCVERGSEFKLDSTHFTVLEGPLTFSSMSVVNGVTSQTYGLKYFIELKEAGDITLNPSSVKINGKTIQSNTVVIHVNNVNYKGNKKAKLDEISNVFDKKPDPLEGIPITKTGPTNLIIEVSSNNVDIGEPVELKFSSNEEGNDLKFDSTYFSIINGPYSNTSTFLKNGVATRTYGTGYFIEFKKKGDITLGPATIRINDKIVQSDKVVIHVNKTVYKGDKRQKIFELSTGYNKDADPKKYKPVSEEDLMKMIDSVKNNKTPQTKTK